MEQLMNETGTTAERHGGAIAVLPVLYALDRPGQEASVFADRARLDEAIALGRYPAGTTVREFRRPDGAPWLIAHEARPDWGRAERAGLVRRTPLWEAVNLEYPSDPGATPRRTVTHCPSEEQAREFAYPDMADAARPCTHGWTTLTAVGPLVARARRRITSLLETSGADGAPVPSQPFANFVAAAMAQLAGLRVHGWVFSASGEVSFSLTDGEESPERAKALTEGQWAVADWSDEDPDELVHVTLASLRDGAIELTRFEATRRAAAHVLIPWVADHDMGTHRTWTAESVIADLPTAMDVACESFEAWGDRVDWELLLAEHADLRGEE